MTIITSSSSRYAPQHYELVQGQVGGRVGRGGGGGGGYRGRGVVHGIPPLTLLIGHGAYWSRHKQVIDSIPTLGRTFSLNIS